MNPDNSYATLMSLLEMGYDLVRWDLVHEHDPSNPPCPLCQMIANQINTQTDKGIPGMSLAAFLGLREMVKATQTAEGDVIVQESEEEQLTPEEEEERDQQIQTELQEEKALAADENRLPDVRIPDGYEVGVPIYKEAPIYNWSHVGCKCCVNVYKSSDILENGNEDNLVIVTTEG